MTPPTSAPAFRVRLAAEQFVTARDGVTTRHCFSFGRHYDAERTGIGPLVALNDELLGERGGYPRHHHGGLEIVSWVLDGSLRHEDSTGRVETIRRHTVQRLTAGTGVDHSESNAGDAGRPLRFLQLWFALDEDVPPSYEARAVPEGRTSDAESGGWSTIAASRPSREGVELLVPGVVVMVLRSSTGDIVAWPPHASSWSEWFGYVATGTVRMGDDGALRSGDSVHAAAVGLSGVAEEDVELLVVGFRPMVRGR